jgi:hypothetical protein
LKLALFVVLLASAAAHAAEAPRLAPDRDVTIEYQVSPEGRQPVDVTVAAMAGGRFLRITSDALPTTILVNRDTGRAAIVLPMLRMYADAKIGKYDPERTILHGAAFARLGEREIAGRHCIVWRAVSADGQAEACITPDGVILRGSATSNRRGALGTIEARRVVYGRLGPDAFQVPPDFQKSPVAIDPQGLGQ